MYSSRTGLELDIGVYRQPQRVDCTVFSQSFMATSTRQQIAVATGYRLELIQILGLAQNIRVVVTQSEQHSGKIRIVGPIF